jgi:hypothetical protein
MRSPCGLGVVCGGPGSGVGRRVPVPRPAHTDMRTQPRPGRLARRLPVRHRRHPASSHRPVAAGMRNTQVAVAALVMVEVERRALGDRPAAPGALGEPGSDQGRVLLPCLTVSPTIAAGLPALGRPPGPLLEARPVFTAVGAVRTPRRSTTAPAGTPPSHLSPFYAEFVQVLRHKWNPPEYVAMRENRELNRH